MALHFMSALPSALKSGQDLDFCGKIPNDCEGFSINLSTVEKITEDGDIALHISVRFNKDAVMIKRSCFKGCKWLEEECDGGSVDLKKGDNFKCTITVTDDGYQISFMDTYYCFYKHRIALEKVTHMIVEGDVEIISNQTPSQDKSGEEVKGGDEVEAKVKVSSNFCGPSYCNPYPCCYPPPCWNPCPCPPPPCWRRC